MPDELNKNNNIEEAAEELEEVNPTDDASASVKDDTQSVEDDIVFDEDAELGTTEVIKKLRAKLKIAVEEKQTYLNNWQRDKAEFINVRKRDEDAKAEFFKFAKQAVIEDFLPVLDSFDMAMANTTQWESLSKEWRVGVEGIYNQLVAVLAKNDIKAFGAIADDFDPNLHHSIGMVQTDKKAHDNKVAEIMQKGYMMSGKVVRPALVRVFEAA